MVFRSVIGFEDNPPEDVVTCAVAPIDALTGRIVQRKVTASVTVAGETAESETLKLPDKPIRNLSGLLVFINLPDHPKYQVHVKARAAGYFDPEPADFTPPEPDDDSDPKDRLRLDFPLFPRPDFAFTDEVTLVSGVIVRGTEGVEEARILVIVPTPSIGMGNPPQPQVFETRSDERGAFALALRLPAFSENGESSDGEDGSDKGVPVKFRIDTKNINGEWVLALETDKGMKITEGRRHVFKSPLDLDNPDNSPVLIS